MHHRFHASEFSVPGAKGMPCGEAPEERFFLPRAWRVGSALSALETRLSRSVNLRWVSISVSATIGFRSEQIRVSYAHEEEDHLGYCIFYLQSSTQHRTCSAPSRARRGCRVWVCHPYPTSGT